jgi:uncharacterized protein YbjT (DUF2867 family)
MRAAVVGATGTIGSPLATALAQAGHDVVAVSRRGRRTDDESPISYVAADAADDGAIARAVDGAEVVYHLVHSLGQPNFEEADRAAARAVAAGAAAGGAKQIVYLGGLADERRDLSPHLRSRAETARLLAEGPVPVTVLGAAMIVGEGSAAFETILALVNRLPVMVCPRWVSVETQPVALTDVVRALLAVAGRVSTFGQSYDVGGPEVMTYRSMLERTARLRGKRPLLIEVPFLTPRLSSLWLHLVTPVSAPVARPLVEGLKIPTVARDERIWDLVAERRTPFDEAVDRVLREKDLVPRSRGS